MPVIVERPTQLSEQDRTDLGRIYADAPAWLLPPMPTPGTWWRKAWRRAGC